MIRDDEPLDAERIAGIRKTGTSASNGDTKRGMLQFFYVDDVLDLCDEVEDLRRRLQEAEAKVPAPPGKLARTYLSVEDFKEAATDLMDAGLLDAHPARQRLVNAYETLHAVAEQSPTFYLKDHPESELKEVLKDILTHIKACDRSIGPDEMCDCARYIGAQIIGYHQNTVDLMPLIQKNGDRLDKIDAYVKDLLPENFLQILSKLERISAIAHGHRETERSNYYLDTTRAQNFPNERTKAVAKHCEKLIREVCEITEEKAK